MTAGINQILATIWEISVFRNLSVSAFQRSIYQLRSAIKRLVFSVFLSYLFGVGMTIEQIAEEALALPSESRALLADKLVESLDTAALSRTDEAWLAEAKRRRDDVRSGKVRIERLKS